MKMILVVASIVVLAFCVAVNPHLIGALVPFALVCGALFAPMFLSRRRAVVENGRVPIFEAVCRGSFGRLGRTSVPSIRMSIYNDFLVVAYFTPTVIPFFDIKSAKMLNILLGHWLLLQTKNGASYRLYVKIPDEILRLLHCAS